MVEHRPVSLQHAKCLNSSGRQPPVASRNALELKSRSICAPPQGTRHPVGFGLARCWLAWAKDSRHPSWSGSSGSAESEVFEVHFNKNLNDIEIFGKFITPIRKNRLRKTTIKWESCSSNTPKVSETMTSAFSSSEKVKVVLWPSLTWIDSFKGCFSWPKTNQFWIKFDLKHHNIIQTFYKPSKFKQNIRYPGIRRRRLCRHM